MVSGQFLSMSLGHQVLRFSLMKVTNKIRRQSSVLLLTFFMLTSTFVKKEPVQVTTPASVSEIKIPETNVLQILVDPEGKIFMSLDKQQDMQAVISYNYYTNKIDKLTYGLDEVGFSIVQTFAATH